MSVTYQRECAYDDFRKCLVILFYFIDSAQLQSSQALSKKKRLFEEKYLQVSNYVTTWNQTVQHKFLIFSIDSLRSAFFFFLFSSSPHSAAILCLSHRNHYHTTSRCVYEKKSKTQNMGQTDIFFIVAENKWDPHMRTTQQSFFSVSQKIDGQQVASPPGWVRERHKEGSPFGVRLILFFIRQNVSVRRRPESYKNWKVKMPRVTAADYFFFLLLYFSPARGLRCCVICFLSRSTRLCCASSLIFVFFFFPGSRLQWALLVFGSTCSWNSFFLWFHFIPKSCVECLSIATSSFVAHSGTE